MFQQDSWVIANPDTCATCLQMTPRWTENPSSQPECYRIVLTRGRKKWGGVYWQYPTDNWCEKPGLDLSRMGFSRITFQTRGEIGGERIRFKSGHDCPEESLTTPEKIVTLTTEMAI